MFDRYGLALLAFVCCWAGAASAAEYYVSPNGNDRSSGRSVSQAWRTIATANSVVKAGDTVYLMGGTYIDDRIAPAQSGAPGADIHYVAYQGQVPVLTSNSIEGLYPAIELSNRSHITVDGVHVNGQQPNPGAVVKFFATIVNGSHNTLRNCDFRYAFGWYGVLLDGGSHHNRILDSVIDYVGIYNNGSDANQDEGDMIDIREGAHHNLVRGNTITHGPHNLVSVRGEYNAIVENVLDNNFYSLGPELGGRDAEIVGQRNLFEGNVVRNAGISSDAPSNAGMKAEGRGNIVRRNVIYNSSAEGIMTETRTRQPYARDTHIFHNTIYSNGGPAWRITVYDGGTTPTGNIFKNNIVYANRKKPIRDSEDRDFSFQLGSSAGVMSDTLVENNIIVSTQPGGLLIGITDGGGLQSFDEAAQRFPSNFKNNIHTAPSFVSSSPLEPEDFELRAGSAGVNAGAALTRTVNSGTGFLVPVEDAGFFSDGFGVMPGDTIRVGSAAAVQIISVDYAQNMITISRPIQWQTGASVNLDYTGTAPDIGARESGIGVLTGLRPETPELFVGQ